MTNPRALGLKRGAGVKINDRHYLRYDRDGVDGVLLVDAAAEAVVRAVDTLDSAGLWEVLEIGPGGTTARMRVPGGWLVRGVHNASMAMIFFADVTHQWATQKNKKASDP